MKKFVCGIFAFIISISNIYAQYTSVSYYIVAHPDDWQLFMGVNAFNDIVAGGEGYGKKVVIIYTTSGDGNCIKKKLNTGYIRSRQEGANRSVRFCADIYSRHAASSNSVVNIKGITEHQIRLLRYKNTASYFLALPDGCFEATPLSIAKLSNGDIPSLTSIDSTTTYFGYQDLLQTIGNIIRNESNGAGEISINCPDWDTKINIGDHSDHVQSGRLATQVAAKMPCVNLRLFMGYESIHHPVNLSPEDLAKETALVSQLSFGLTRNGQTTEWDTESPVGHVGWAYRNYFRTLISCDSGSITNNDWEKDFYADSAMELTKYFVKIFPNPASNVINVTYEIMTEGPVNIVIYDLYGRQMGIIVNEHKDKGIHTTSFNIEQLKKGSYTIYAKTPQNIKVIPFAKQ